MKDGQSRWGRPNPRQSVQGAFLSVGECRVTVQDLARCGEAVDVHDLGPVGHYYLNPQHIVEADVAEELGGATNIVRGVPGHAPLFIDQNDGFVVWARCRGDIPAAAQVASHGRQRGETEGGDQYPSHGARTIMGIPEVFNGV